MITKEELQNLLTTTEAYRVERTISPTDKEKFGEAVCAFANDMPDTGKPGYLLVGVHDNGRLSGLKATDELMKKFGSLRSDGNILPIPSISVDSFSFDDGDVIVVNHGSLYGRVRPENFPNASDYRNPVIAEAMKVLGYVNCYNRGIADVQKELAANGNGPAEFSFRLITAFEAKVAKAGRQHEPDQPKEGLDTESSMKSSMKSDNRLLLVISEDHTMSLPKMADKIGLSVAGVRKVLERLRAAGRIRRVGPDKGGHWEIVK